MWSWYVYYNCTLKCLVISSGTEKPAPAWLHLHQGPLRQHLGPQGSEVTAKAIETGSGRIQHKDCPASAESDLRTDFYHPNANDGYQGINILFTPQMPMTDIKVWTYFLPPKCQWQISRYEQTFTTQMPMTEISRLMQMFTFKNIWQFTTMKMCSDAIFCQTSCKI